MPSQPKQNYQVVRRSRWKTLARKLVADPWRKLVALLLAGCCWWILNLTLHRTDNHRWETIDHVPVIFQPRDARRTHDFFDDQNISPREVSLAVSIDAWNDSLPVARDFQVRIHPQRLEFSNDGLRTQPLVATYELTPTDLVVKPEGVALRNFLPATVTFQWDRIIAKEVPIRLHVTDRLPEHLSYRVPDLPSIHVIGPAFRVNQITELETEPLLLETQEPGPVFFGNVQLLPEGQFAGVELERSALPIRLEVVDQSKPQGRVIKELKLNYLTNPDSALTIQDTSALPRMVSIYVAGPAGILEKLDPRSLLALCDLTSYSMQGAQDVPIQIHNLPPEVKVTRILPTEQIRVVLALPNSP